MARKLFFFVLICNVSAVQAFEIEPERLKNIGAFLFSGAASVVGIIQLVASKRDAPICPAGTDRCCYAPRGRVLEGDNGKIIMDCSTGITDKACPLDSEFVCFRNLWVEPPKFVHYNYSLPSLWKLENVLLGLTFLSISGATLIWKSMRSRLIDGTETEIAPPTLLKICAG